MKFLQHVNKAIMITRFLLGNNFYGNEVKEKIEEIGASSERDGFILMDRVFPPPLVIINYSRV